MRWKLLVTAAAIAAGLGVTACRSAKPAPQPAAVGASLPELRGEALDGKEWQLPRDLAGKPAVLLVGYLMESQFDCDRWLLGLLQSATPVQVLELPTIKGMIPGMFAGVIDSGMRSGIPSEDWCSVVTLYGDDAERMQAFTGGSVDRNARILLLDAEGRVCWQHDRGYSAGRMVELDRAARALADGSGSPAR